jgi:hypothetical protein
MEAFCEPVELTTSELVAVTGGSTVKAGPMTLNINIEVAAANGVADGVANGVGNIVLGARGPVTIGTGDGGGNGGVTFI